jgi:uncharacterized membrane protein YvbJ
VGNVVKFCKDCGTENTNGAKRCKGCGSVFITSWWRRKEVELNDKI